MTRREATLIRVVALGSGLLLSVHAARFLHRPWPAGVGPARARGRDRGGWHRLLTTELPTRRTRLPGSYEGSDLAAPRVRTPVVA
jgi:hypothetical protein